MAGTFKIVEGTVLLIDEDGNTVKLVPTGTPQTPDALMVVADGLKGELQHLNEKMDELINFLKMVID